MAKKQRLFDSEAYHSLHEVAEFLRDLANSLEAGEVTLRQGEQELSLTLPAQVELEIEVDKKVKRHTTKHSLEIEIDWKEEDFAGKVTVG